MKQLVLYLSILILLVSVSCEKKSRLSDDTTAENKIPDKYDNYTDWAIYRGDKKSNQYAELAQIHAANVHKLKPVWE